MFAVNVSKMNELNYCMAYSLAKTLACKHKTGVSKIWRKYRTGNAIEVVVPREGKNSLIATFGAMNLKRRKENFSSKHQEDKFMTVYNSRSELLKRMLADKCELCGKEGEIEIHHIKKMSDLKRKYNGKKEIPEWKERMIAVNRKTLIVCRDCHNLIHSGKYDGTKLTKV